MTALEGPIDPAWWGGVLPATTVDATSASATGTGSIDPLGRKKWEPPELFATSLRALADEAPEGTLRQRVLSVLAHVAWMMLEAGDWADPFRPVVVWADGSRTGLPDDLGDEDIALLASVAPLLEHLPTRARVADVAWTYGDRGNQELLGIALDAYLATPLDRAEWHGVSKGSWVRALEIIRHRGNGEAGRRGRALEQIRVRLLAATAADGYLVVELADLYRHSGKLDQDAERELADRLIDVAANAAPTRLSRHLERVAQKLLARLGAADEVHACTVRIAACYESEAARRIESGNASELAAGIFLEKAISTLQSLPRKYRQSEGIDDHLVGLRQRLAENRTLTLESMIAIETEPVNITEQVRAAERAVTGLPRFAALVRLASTPPLTDAERARADAQEALSTASLSRLFGRATFTSDGRKVATSGGGIGDPEESELWSEVVRRFGYRMNLVVNACIVPALDVVAAEHRFDLGFVRRLCADAPLVPPAHVDLWARGLRHGLNGDFPEAVSLLVPQAEQLLRHHLKRGGVNTLTMDPLTGVESERGLGSLLAMSEARDFLGADLHLEMRALLVDQEGPNLRNETAHGLLTDSGAWSTGSVYAWWLLLRVVVVPLWHAIREGDDDAEVPPTR
ncbi:DUF4209 domain-containing protein [Nocardioides ochotonae]|uniref:DUF4209 domain-containing protein n=1 Tax=Nocardioides ochotonae TaxID=2685869 RepID=UPI00140E40DC